VLAVPHFCCLPDLRTLLYPVHPKIWTITQMALTHGNYTLFHPTHGISRARGMMVIDSTSVLTAKKSYIK